MIHIPQDASILGVLQPQCIFLNSLNSTYPFLTFFQCQPILISFSCLSCTTKIDMVSPSIENEHLFFRIKIQICNVSQQTLPNSVMSFHTIVH